MALVSQQLPCPACIAGREDGLALQAALALPRLVLKEVTDSRLRPHELARVRPLEPLGGAAVRLHLRHLFYAPAFSTLPAPLPAASPAADPATGPFPAGPAGAVGAAGSASLRACGEPPDATPVGAVGGDGADSAGRSPWEPLRCGSLGGGFTTRFTGDSTIVMLRPSCFGAASTCEISLKSLASRSRSFAPSSVWAISRPRNMIVTLTLSPSSRNRSTWPFLMLKSWSEIFGRNFISLTMTWDCFLRDSLARTSCSYFHLPKSMIRQTGGSA